MTLTSGSNITGTLYNKGISTPHTATLYYFDNGDIIIETESTTKKLHISALSISSRVANTQRQIFMPDGDIFTTHDNNAVDTMIAKISPEKKDTMQSLLYYLESHVAAILSLIAVSIIAVFIFIKFIFPTIVTYIAFSIPASTLHLISEKTIEYLDNQFFTQTQLSQTRIHTINAQFKEFIASIPEKNKYTFTLYFRHSNFIGPNAFALPDGTFIITDDFVKLIQHKHELFTILAHETAHVVYRHGVRNILLNSGLLVIAIAIFGDVVSTTTIGLPLLLIHNGYSREFERQADAFAIDYCKKNHISGKHFVNLYKRLQQKAPTNIPSLLSTHPSDEERLSSFMAIDNP
ncbi:MAG TPA: M48 family metallopeptidase [Spirochaetota bacterium]|nr:M48 family metallopeptidase [Spirochaetota bacterium]